MKPNLKRNDVFELLGTKPTNPRWSWCAISPDHRRAVFTIWEDEVSYGKNRLISNIQSVTRRNGEADLKRIIDLVIDNNIPAYGLVCTAHDPQAPTRIIKEVRGDYVISLQIEKDADGIIAKHGKLVLLAELVANIGRLRYSQNNGLLDLENAPHGTDTPDRALTSGWTVIRDNKVRAYVIKLAGGKCEYCGRDGFAMSNGQRYLEAHHIIALSAAGRDVVDNVIALCPEHHREAHFGINAEKLEEEFKNRILARPKN